MGEVYEAEDLELREHVALKTVRPEIAGDRRTMARFKQEIQLARKVTHPNVCRIFDLFYHRPASPGGEIPFLTMELLPGEALSERFRREGRMTTADALPMVEQMAAGLMAAHQVGVIHRDFKPGNVILVPSKDRGDMRLVITDFGLARTTATGEDAPTALSIQGDVLGTPAYMAPEQVRGRQVTTATDVYSLGVVLYQMVTGTLPFTADTALATAIKRLEEAPPSPRRHVPDLDPQWEAAILRCLAGNPADRFASASDVVGALKGESKAAVPRVPIHPRRSVAVLGFKNLSGRSSAAWLSVALSEMLTTELAAGEKLRTIPGENVARMKIELSLADNDSLAKDTLGRVRRNLGTDLVVLGSYLALGQKAGGQIRLDLRLQDADAGETVAAVAETGTEAQLFELISRAGTHLREKLGIGQLSEAEASGVRASLPANPEAARLYAEGLAKLRLFDALAARDLFQKAVAADPDYALAHSALAEAWQTLGYDANAKREAQMAFDLSANLSREERLSVEGRYRETAWEWEMAVEVFRTLFGFFPDNLEYGLRMAWAQTHSGKGKDALATVAVLRNLPLPAGDDPQIDITEAIASLRLSDFRRGLAAAGRAAAKAVTLGARLLLAEARRWEGEAFLPLGQPLKAMAASEEAKRGFAAAGDRGGVASALANIGNALAQQGNLSGAKDVYEESLAIVREIGSKRGVAAVRNRIAGLLFIQGGVSGARRMHEEALAIFREIGDKAGVAHSLSRISEISFQQGDLSEARKLNQEALTIFREIGDKYGEAGELSKIAGQLFTQGDLSEARRLWEEALSIQREIGNRNGVAAKLANIAGILFRQGDISEARRMDEEALAIWREIGNKEAVAFALRNMAFMFSEQENLSGAKKMHEEALAIWQEMGHKDGVAIALNSIGNVLNNQGDLAGARAMQEEALAIWREIGDKGGLGRGLMSLAHVLHQQGDLAGAEKMFEESLSIHRKIGNKGFSAHSLFGLGDVLSSGGNLDAARKRHEEALALRNEIGEKLWAAVSRLALAALLIEQGRPAEAESKVREAAKEFRGEKRFAYGEISAYELLARSLLAQSKFAGAQKAIDRANALLRGSELLSDRLSVAITAARVQAPASGKRAEAVKSLESVLAEATRTGHLGLQFEARLALGEIEMQSGKTAAGRARLKALEKEAAAKGFGLIARKAAAAKK